MIRRRTNNRISKSLVADNIVFKSRIELLCYNKLKESKLKDYGYERSKIILQDTFTYDGKYYTKGTGTMGLACYGRKILHISYTPDFTIVKNGISHYIETKGYERDDFKIKKKMFLYWLSINSPQSLYIECFNSRQIDEAIQLIENQ